jgi:hypothetical protein
MPALAASPAIISGLAPNLTLEEPSGRSILHQQGNHMSRFFRQPRVARSSGLRTIAIAGAAAGLAAIAGCNSDNTTGPRVTDQGSIIFINAAPRYSSADLYVDSTQAVPGQQYATGQTIYANPTTDARHLVVRASGDSTILASNDLQVVSQMLYSVILTQHDSGGGLLILPDTVSAPPANSIGLRVVNAAPSAGPVDVYITGSDTTLANPTATNVVFEGTSNYVYLPAGVGRVRVTAAGTKTVLLDLDATVLFPGQVRTVLLIDADAGGLPLQWLGIPDIG